MIALAVARAANGVIGLAGELPWRLPDDLKHFRRVTLGKPVIMGRLTYESIGRPLPERTNIVVTRSAGYRAPGCRVVGSLDEALDAAGDAPEVMVIGGAGLFAEALPRAGRIYLTEVHAEPEGDTFFPPYDPTEWREVSREDHPADERNAHAYSFVTLERAA